MITSWSTFAKVVSFTDPIFTYVLVTKRFHRRYCISGKRIDVETYANINDRLGR
jgi:hypothetical protein